MGQWRLRHLHTNHRSRRLRRCRAVQRRHPAAQRSQVRRPQPRMSAPPSSPKQKPPLWAHLVGTFFYIGYGKPGPGTWASVATLILWWFGIRLVPPQSRTLATAIAAVLVTLIGIPAATRVARSWNKKDPSQVVIDEVAGQLV